MDNYKKAILARYDTVKEDLHSDLLGQPTPAKLKELSLLLLDSLNTDDRKIYLRFFKLENPDFNEIKKFDNDKFRPLVRFLKGGSAPTNLLSVELLAVLVDFQPRPYKKFSKAEPIKTRSIDGFAMVNEPRFLYGNEGNKEEGEYIPNSGNLNADKETVGLVSGQSIQSRQDMKNATIPQRFFVTPNRNSNVRANLIKLFAFVLLIAAGVYFVKSNLFEEKGCMIWKYDHYEAVPCDMQINAFAGNKVIPLNKELLTYQKKLKVTDTTTFFNADNSPRVWYGKSANKEYEYFSYPGKHPETGNDLRKITDYMVDKHVKKIK